MKYLEILNELRELNLDSLFDKELKQEAKESVYLRVRSTDKIYSTASLIRHLLRYYNYNSEKWLFWQEVLIYFMTPTFAREAFNEYKIKFKNKTS
jgi:hypothetical protein